MEHACTPFLSFCNVFFTFVDNEVISIFGWSYNKK